MHDKEPGLPQPDGETGVRSLAVAAAMGLSRAEGGSPASAEAYLLEATRLARLQVEEIREARNFAWLGHFSAAMKAGFEGLMAVLVLGVAIVVGSAVWNAAHDSSLVIEAFSVPSDLSGRGLTGHVVAAQIQDKLADMQAQTNSMRAAGSYQNNWGDDIQVQIPDTGVSLGQLNRYLHDWLGHRTYISGEIFGEGDTLTVTARIGSEPAQSVSGKPAELNALLQKAAEAVYGRTQPYRYAVYLMNQNRTKEAAATFTALAANGPAIERAWAYVGLYNLAQNRGDVSGALRNLDRALAVRPDFLLALINKDGIEAQLQHTEASYRAELELARVLHGPAEPDINPAAVAASVSTNDASLAGAKGDNLAVLRHDAETESRPDYSGSVEGARRDDALAFALLHDSAGTRRVLAALPPPVTANDRVNRDGTIFLAATLAGDWQRSLKAAGPFEQDAKALGPALAPIVHRAEWPLKAYALAMTGNIAGARTLIARTPLDCDACLRTRVRIAMAEHDWKAAGHWASLCSARTPSLPQCVSDWGDVLRAKGDYDGAIAKYAIAHVRGPHFADPLEGWGEALIAKKRSDLALAKFEEANKFAPHWARLHLKWGEALMWSGDKPGAQEQFAAAAKLAPTPSEQSELATQRKANG